MSGTFPPFHEDGPKVPRPRPVEACLVRAAAAVIRVDRAEVLIRLTPAKGAAALPPLLMEDSGLLACLRRPPGPWNDR